jgi:transposase
LDIDTGLYVGYAAGFKSEKQLFIEALSMAKAGFEFDSIRLDKYYAYQSIFRCVGGKTRVIVIPKKNATVRGPKEWKRLILDLITRPFLFLAEYFKRVRSEYNFSKDKRRFGRIPQRLEERIITAAFSRATLHNFSTSHLTG